MSTKVSPPKAQEDDDLSPPRRTATTTDHFNPLRQHDTSSRKRHSRENNGSTPSAHRDRPPSPSHQHSRQESSQPAKSERRCLAERYAQWGRGLAQVQQSDDAVKYYLEQAEKPLARYRDDKDLDTMLK